MTKATIDIFGLMKSDRNAAATPKYGIKMDKIMIITTVNGFSPSSIIHPEPLKWHMRGDVTLVVSDEVLW